jgi:bla regulator protein BlaR1
MILVNLSPLVNHLWQSTICAAVAWLLTLALRKNRAAVRYWLWLAASVKFLIPFSLLVSAGSRFGWRATPAIRPHQFSLLMDEISRPFAISTPVPRLIDAPAATNEFSAILFGLWFCGFTILLIAWFRSWRHIRAVQRTAIPLHLNLPIQVMSSPARLEPGVFGIRKPVLLLPEGITDRLTPLQLEAVLAHELCHVRRHDNLTAVIHMAVEAIFWFHPLVWWIRVRLVEERERACDEEVLRVAKDPQIYAEGILNVCKFYLESPLVCASGVTGADLKKRIEKIMAHRAGRKLDPIRKSLLMAVGMVAVVGPIVIGTLNVPRVRAQSQATVTSPPNFEVASIKRNKTGGPPRLRYNPAGIDFANVPLIWIIGEAYQVPYAQISSSDAHIGDLFFSPAGTTYFYDVAARAGHAEPKAEIRLMLRSLLENRFKLTLHHEPKLVPVYKLVVGKSGSKLLESAAEGEPSGALGLNGFVCRNLEMARFASMLSVRMDRPVVDLTGLKGSYDFTLKSNLPTETEKTALSDWFSSSIFTDIQRQLGLQLETDKAPVDYLVVDHVEQPSEN